MGEFVGHDDLGVPQIALFEQGKIAEKYLLAISEHNDAVKLEKYVIMPNHIHAIICIEKNSGVPRSSRPTNGLSGIIGCFKRFTNKEAGQNMWQTSFYDHIIRDDEEHERIWQYIDSNPVKWLDDIYYQ